MVRVTPRTRGVIVAQALARARAEAVQLQLISGQYFARSSANPDRYYWLDDDGCTCPGYFRTGMCKHLAAYLSATHQLPEISDPEPVATPRPQLAGPVAERISEAMSAAAIDYMVEASKVRAAQRGGQRFASAAEVAAARPRAESRG